MTASLTQADAEAAARPKKEGGRSAELSLPTRLRSQAGPKQAIEM
jgi:hypothetical protein